MLQRPRDSIIQDEIQRELTRAGQVFFVYNRVEGIDEMAARIRRLVPDAKVGVAMVGCLLTN